MAGVLGHFARYGEIMDSMTDAELHLHTDRLLMRPAELGDAQAIFNAYASDPEATKYLVFETLTDATYVSLLSGATGDTCREATAKRAR